MVPSPWDLNTHRITVWIRQSWQHWKIPSYLGERSVQNTSIIAHLAIWNKGFSWADKKIREGVGGGIHTHLGEQCLHLLQPPSVVRPLQAQAIQHFSSCCQTPAPLLAAWLCDIHIVLFEEDNLDTVSHEAHENVQSQRAFPVVLRGFLHINLFLWNLEQPVKIIPL